MAVALVDNDVLIKTTAYGLLSMMINSAPFGVRHFSMLGAAKFIILRRLRKRAPARGFELVLKEFQSSISTFFEIEPSDDEIRVAAELEFLAKELDLELDSGESILCAVLMSRKSDYIFTGDKRAIHAVSGLIARGNGALTGKIVCLEQISMWLIEHANSTEVRSAVCAEPAVDIGLAACFSCYSPSVQVESWRQGLMSYIEDLKQRAPGVLASYG